MNRSIYQIKSIMRDANSINWLQIIKVSVIIQMSWSKFLTISPPVLPTEVVDQLKSSMKKKSLRLDQSAGDQPMFFTTEGSQKRTSSKNDQQSSLNSLHYRPNDSKNTNSSQFNQATLSQINQTLKEIRLLTIESNNNMKRFLNFMEQKSTERIHRKSRNRDAKSTIKKSKSKQIIEDKIGSRFSEFDKLRKQFESCIRRISTTSKLPRK